MDREFEVIWTEPAIEDLRDLVVHVAQSNPAAAERIRLAILKHVGTLKTFPFIGPAYSERSPRVRLIAYKKYRIYYDVRDDPDRVEILAIRHGARQDLGYDPDEL